MAATSGADSDTAEDHVAEAEAEEAPAAAETPAATHRKVRLWLDGEQMERRPPVSRRAFAALPAPPVPQLVSGPPAAAAAFVERPLEPMVRRGRGMHVLGFVTAFKLPPPAPSQPSDAEPPAAEAEAEEAEAGAGAEAEGEAEAAAAAESGTSADAGAAKAGGGVSRKHDGYRQMHGSYRNYYGYRPGGSEPGALDSRLRALAAELGDECFKGCKVLDIGCNTGEISLAVAKHLGARRVIGCDIDPDLVDAAIASRDALASGSKSVPSSEGSGACKVTYRVQDFLEGPMRRSAAGELETFDALLCFSVTKWVHFFRGDAGVKELFSRAFKCLSPGGIFVLEPQEWSSYKKKRHLSADIRKNVAGIELRPEAFDEFLVGLGFVRKVTIAAPAEGPQGFRRSIRVFVKPQLGQRADEVPPSRGKRPQGCGSGDAAELEEAAGALRKKKRGGGA